MFIRPSSLLFPAAQGVTTRRLLVKDRVGVIVWIRILRFAGSEASSAIMPCSSPSARWPMSRPVLPPDAGGLEFIVLPDGTVNQQTVRFFKPRQDGVIGFTETRCVESASDRCGGFR